MRRVCCALVVAVLALVAAGGASGAGARLWPESVTFVSLAHGWALGTVGCGSHRCLALRETTDGGRSWTARPLPAALRTAADRRPGGPASLQVRFADPRDGWIFGYVPKSATAIEEVLWSTHDGGASWRRQALAAFGDQPAVLDLEAASGVAYAVIASPAPAVVVASTPVGADDWHADRAPHLGLPAGGGGLQAAIVLAAGGGWLVEGNDRGFTGSGRLAGGAWAKWTPPCAAVGDSLGFPAASNATDLVAVCVMGGFAFPLSPAAPHGAKVGEAWLYSSTDGGASFQAVRRLGAPGGLGYAAATGGPIASPAPGVVFLGGGNDGQDLLGSFDDGAHWSVAYRGTTLFVGFTSPQQGVAIMRGAGGSTTLIMTFDGGRHWAPVAV